jgi:hypothetical protein
MSKNIFINNYDTYVSQAIFKELRNDDKDENGEMNPDANRIFGTYITKDSSEAPNGIKKMLKVSYCLQAVTSNHHSLQNCLRLVQISCHANSRVLTSFHCLSIAFETELGDDIHL